MRPEASNLENEDAVVVEEIIHLAQERLVPPDADVLQRIRHVSITSLTKERDATRTSAISKLTILVYAPLPPGM